MSQPAWGASAGAWNHFSLTLGLTRDLLPVVANPNAPISENSKMREKGKTPSQYNRDRKVVGFTEWTKHEASEAQIKRWSRDSDLGICVQTHRMRAIDVDIVDQATASAVRECIEGFLFAEEFDQCEPARRTRGNSPKFLVPIWLDGTYAKRTIRTAHGIIEFLANGQQFVAVSTHPSGERYEWSTGEVPTAELIPRLTPAQFERLWALLQERFGIEPGAEARRGGAQPTRPRSLADANDPILGYLEARGWVVDYQGDGRVDVRCPWEHEHTTDTGSSSTTYFPRGVGGFQQGHFRCLHAHCAQRSDGDFLEAVGWNTEDFPLVLTEAERDALELTDGLPEGVQVQIIEAGAAEVASTDRPLPKFKRDGRTGKVKAIIENLILALSEPRVTGQHLGYDAFTDSVMLAPAVVGEDGALQDTPVHARQWVPVTEATRVELRLRLEAGNTGFEPIGRENMRDAVTAVAHRFRFDSAIEWLTHRVPRWDGVPRIDTFFPRYFRSANTAYTQAVGAYAWTALAGRVLKPGCKADMVPLLIGPGGTGKTTGVAALAPSPESFAELSLAVRDDDLARRLRGVLVGELGELRGLGTRESDAIKQWLSRTHEEWTPKFQEYKTTFARRCVFFGTTNNEQALVDDGAGLRRWLPVHVGRTDLAALEADREQLWAEARERFLQGGVAWQQADQLALRARADSTDVDPWTEPVRQWLLGCDFADEETGETQPRYMGPLTTVGVAVGALGIPAKNCGRVEQRRIGQVLRALGARPVTVRVGGSGKQGFRVVDTQLFANTWGEGLEGPEDVGDLV